MPLEQTLTARFSTDCPVGSMLPARCVPEIVRRVFGVEFSLFDAITGEFAHLAEEQPDADWALLGGLCQEVARRGRPELIQEEEPLTVLAIPLPVTEGGSGVALGMFISRAVLAEGELRPAARHMGMEPREAFRWACRQIPWAPEALLRVGCLVMDELAARRRIQDLQRESESLSVQMAATYEEISLLHRLTQNLKISESDEGLARLALEWLYEVLPAEGLAVELLAVVDERNSLTPNGRSATMFLPCARCPVDHPRFGQLTAHLMPSASGRPLVINDRVTRRPDWPFGEIHQMILVPLMEGQNLFGWLSAFNHRLGGEFGTVEASLLSSVGTILGIHSGNIELYRQRSELLTGIVRALTTAIEAKDRYTCGHSDRVARVAVRLAQEMGCDANTVDRIYLSGLLHDIGKIGIDDSVLRKPGSLTDAEYEHIKTHVSIGHRILIDLKRLDDVLPVVLHHHEAWDGEGYPNRLPGEQIPLSARIVAVADSFDAMGSDRPYRKGMPDERIDEIFRAGAGKQWDPQVVAALFRARDDIRRISNEERKQIEISLSSALRIAEA